MEKGPELTEDGNPYNYLVVIDSGSSGSRCYVYHYPSVAEDSDNDFAVATTKKGKRPFPHVSQEGKKWRKKIRPGIATLAGEKKAIQGHIKELVEFAEKVVPKSQRARTPLFLHATGGVRLLKKKQQHALLTTACEWTQKHSQFLVPDCETHFNAISGQVEGIFGWVALNYLIGGIDDPTSHDHGKDHYTYGFLDMGGASTQIAFIPNTTEVDRHKPDLFKVRLTAFDEEDDQLNDVFSESFQGLGVNEARRSFLRSKALNKTTDGVIEDPCVPKGLRSTFTKRQLFSRDIDDFEEDLKEHFKGAMDEMDEMGTAAMDEMNEMGTAAKEAMGFKTTSSDDDEEDEDDHEDDDEEGEKDHEDDDDEGKDKQDEDDSSKGAPKDDDAEDPDAEFIFVGTGDYDKCNIMLDPLLEDIKNAKKPDFDFEVNHFVGVSEYWDTSDGFEMGGDLDYALLSERVKEFCNTPWEKIVETSEEEFPNVKMKDLKQLCFKSSWLLNVINDGFNFPSMPRNDSGNHGLDSYMHPLQSVEEINGVEYSWTLGRALLYAASELGTNGKEGGIQKNSASSKWDFGREAGPWRRPDFKGHISDDDDDDGTSWNDLLEKGGHRFYGSMVFLVVLIAIIYLLLGRQRRRQIWESAKSRTGFGGHQYVNLGTTSMRSSDFELGNLPDEYDLDEEGNSDDKITV